MLACACCCAIHATVGRLRHLPKHCSHTVLLLSPLVLIVALQAEVPGVFGRVSELVRVTNRKYNLAMAVVMQRDLDSVVVADRAAGFACVDFLKANK